MKKAEKLYLETFREIRSYIINNGLKPGDMLPTEQAMCERWGVSRNVLREAIKSMELMGMVQACPGRGTQVKDFNLDFIFQNVLFFNMGDPEDDARVREMFGIRKMLELGYMRQAFKALSGEDIAYMPVSYTHLGAAEYRLRCAGYGGKSNACRSADASHGQRRGRCAHAAKHAEAARLFKRRGRRKIWRGDAGSG